MEAERKRQILLAVLAVVLAIVVYRSWPTTSPASPPSSKQQRASGTSGAVADRTRKDASAASATDVHLEALEAERPKPGPTERNLFRFREKRQPPKTGGGMPEPPVPSNTPTEPAGPP